VRTQSLRILDVDTECKPGHWIGGDYVSKLITTIAWGWIGGTVVDVVDHYTSSRRYFLAGFAEVYDDADIIVTHYGRGFDFPLLNGAMERESLPRLDRKLTIDTKLDRYKTLGRSQSQKNLSADYGIKNPKVDITLRQWEGYNECEPGYRDFVIERCKMDVEQNISLYRALVDADMLGPPRMMRYEPSGSARYVG
jgi:hypothetical protein